MKERKKEEEKRMLGVHRIMTLRMSEVKGFTFYLHYFIKEKRPGGINRLLQNCTGRGRIL